MFFGIPVTEERSPQWPQASTYVRAQCIPAGGSMDIPVLSANMLVVGTSGYGKTVFTKAYVRELFKANPDRYAVFFQIKPGDFTDEFLRPGDKVITYSETMFPKANCFRWNLVKEIRSCNKAEWETELEALAAILFSDMLLDSRNRIWAEAAKTTFKDFIKVILYCYGNNPSNRELIHAMKSMGQQELLKFLAKYPPNRSMLRDNFAFDAQRCENYRMPKKGSDIFFFLQNVLEKFGGSFLSADGQDTLFDYMHGHYGRRLFIIHDHKTRSSSRLFEQYFMKRIGDEMLSQSSGFRGKMVWVLDEIDKIEHDFGLTQAVTLGRQFGLQVLVSTQSLESLYAVAPELHGEHLTNAALSGFGITVAFHPGDPHTIETLQTLYGQCEKQDIVLPLSRYDSMTVTTAMRPMVEDSDFASLRRGECYVKIFSEPPRRVRIVI